MITNSIYAFSVEPSKDRVTAITKGGFVKISDDLRFIIQKNIGTANFSGKSTVDFKFDKKRNNDVRQEIMSFAFGDKNKQQSSAKKLAERLSLALDGRSKSALFMVVNHSDGKSGKLTLWTFPSDEAFRLRLGTTNINMDVVKDIFSNTSYLRKAALFEGPDSKSAFTSGKVLDFQSMSADADVAKIWVERFLQCQMSITSESGSRILGKALRKVSKNVADAALQTKITTAAVAIQNSPKDQLNFKEIRDNYIPKELQASFTTAIGGEKMLPFTFKKNEAVLSNHIGVTTYQLDTGVVVSSPLTEIGESVSIDVDSDKKLSCSGFIKSERLRGQRA